MTGLESGDVDLMLASKGHVFLATPLTELIAKAVPTGEYVLTDMVLTDTSGPEPLPVRARLVVQVVDEYAPMGDGMQLLGFSFPPPTHAFEALFAGMFGLGTPEGSDVPATFRPSPEPLVAHANKPMRPFDCAPTIDPNWQPSGEDRTCTCGYGRQSPNGLIFLDGFCAQWCGGDAPPSAVFAPTRLQKSAMAEEVRERAAGLPRFEAAFSGDAPPVIEPTNRIGATEQQWNDWIKASEEYQRANPEPRHQPYEVCTCGNVPQLATDATGGHCAARGPIVPWVAQDVRVITELHDGVEIQCIAEGENPCLWANQRTRRISHQYGPGCALRNFAPRGRRDG